MEIKPRSLGTGPTLLLIFVLPLDRSILMIHISIMKVATVADLRNRFRRVSAWLENGEAVRIVKRGRAFASLTPLPKTTVRPKVDFARQMRTIWGKRFFDDNAIRLMRDYDREGEEG